MKNKTVVKMEDRNALSNGCTIAQTVKTYLQCASCTRLPLFPQGADTRCLECVDLGLVTRIKEMEIIERKYVNAT